MVPQIRVPAALAEDPGSVPSTHLVALGHLSLQFQEFWCLLLPPCPCGPQTQLWAKQPYT